MPSPARLLDAVVRWYILVMPPVHRITAAHLILIGADVGTSTPTAPMTSPFRTTTSVTLTLLSLRMLASRLVLLRNAAQIAAPVLKKSTYTQRWRLWPGALTWLILPSARRAQLTFQPASSRIRLGLPSHSSAARFSLQRPRPALSVSSRCSCGPRRLPRTFRRRHPRQPGHRRQA